MEKNIYLFLDWSMTTNELIENGKINERKFQDFYNVLSDIERELNTTIHFIIVSGTNKTTATTRFSILKQAFNSKNNTHIFGGFAYEYGGFLINEYGKTIQLEKDVIPFEFQEKIKLISEKYGYNKSEDFSLYINFEFDALDERAKSFIKDCKDACQGLDFDVYDDKYGHGFDIKNQTLNKGEFVQKYLNSFCNDKNPIIIVGGDSIQDLKMYSTLKAKEKYFLGFEGYATEKRENVFISPQTNIEGITWSLKNFLKYKTTKK